MGMLCAKPQLLTDSFHYPKRVVKDKKQKSATRANPSRKSKTPKDPKPKRTPLTPEARKERQRTSFKKKLEDAKSLGLCRHCPEPAIEGQTRCEKCAERHRARHREDDSRRRAAAKLSEEKPTQEPVAPPSQEATAPQPGQQAEHEKAKPAGEASALTSRQEYGRPGSQRSEREEIRPSSEQRQRERRKAAGLCKDCSEPSKPGRSRCEGCSEQRRLREREARARKKAESQQANADQ